jgi:oligoribonuclease (3'-5' exoribonuclease)
VFDRDRFAMSTMDDAELQREVIGLFVNQVDETCAHLAGGSISSEDRKFLGHNLRGAAAAVGALHIEELAKSWESVSYDLAVLRELLQQAKTAFLAKARPFIS